MKATTAGARLARVGMSNAKKAIFNLEDELKAMSEEDHNKFGDSVFKALKAKTAKTQSSPLFRATVFPSRQSNKGREEDLCADTGCTKPIVGAEICREQKIHIQPLAGGMTITDASGNKLNIIGTAVFLHSI